MDLLDRSIVLHGADDDTLKDRFLRISMACFLLAMKIRMPRVRFLDTLLHLGRDRHSEEEVLDAEVAIIVALEGRLETPTGNSFLVCYERFWIALFRHGATDAVVMRFLREVIIDRAQFLIELSVLDSYFIGHRPSIVALAAVQVALENEQPLVNHMASHGLHGNAIIALPNLPIAWANDNHTLGGLKARLRFLNARHNLPSARL